MEMIRVLDNSKFKTEEQWHPIHFKQSYSGWMDGSGKESAENATIDVYGMLFGTM